MSNFCLNSEAVRRYLTRALTGDTERERPPVTLAGQRPDRIPQPTPPPPPAPPMWTGDLRNRSRATSGAAEAEPGDEQGPYTYAELVQMNNKFRARLLRAFKRGKESRQAAANQIAAPRW
jgi:hypothetical protein